MRAIFALILIAIPSAVFAHPEVVVHTHANGVTHGGPDFGLATIAVVVAAVALGAMLIIRNTRR